MPRACHAEEPNQVVNVDLCFVPATHAPAEPVPAVSGSSGRLLVSRPKVLEEERTWPGKVFEREELSYTEAMDKFVALRLAKRAEKGEAKSVDGGWVGDQKSQKLALRTGI